MARRGSPASLDRMQLERGVYPAPDAPGPGVDVDGPGSAEASLAAFRDAASAVA